MKGGLFSMPLYAFVLLVPVSAEDPIAAGREIRVGTFDSRLVAIAYVRSDAFEQRLKKLQTNLDAAEQSGKKDRAKELATQGAILQRKVHLQSFSTLSIDDILQTIKHQVSQISADSKVDVMLSKWDVAFLGKATKQIDLTDQLLVPFKPDNETKRVLNQVRGTRPVPLDSMLATENKHAL